MGGGVSQVTVLGDWNQELDPGEWWVVSQGSNGAAGKKGKKGKKRNRDQEGGTFRMAGELVFLTREEAEAHLTLTARGTTGTTGTEMTRGTRLVTRVTELTRGVGWGVTRGVPRKGTRGVRRGVPGARMSPGSLPPRTRGNLRVATCEWGPGGGGGAGGLIGLSGLIGLTHHQVNCCRPDK